MKVGIEDVNLYASSLILDITDLAEARGQDGAQVVSDYMMHSRSVLPLWEDTITLAANAAAPLLNEKTRDEIGLFIVGTESGLDFGKPISTNLLDILSLPENVRNFETKHACYSGMAAISSALAWIKSGLNRQRKALIVCADYSRQHLNTKEEFVLGGVAAAVLLSSSPEIVEYEFDAWGCFSKHAYDTFRPTAKNEIGNNEVSLFSYLDALEGSYEDYQNQLGKDIDIDDYFKRISFHTPFAGMAFQAYRTLCRLAKRKSRQQLSKDFARFVEPALTISRSVGSCYSVSNIAGIISLILGDDTLKAGDRIAHFAYGSGSIGEFYSVRLLPQAREKLLEKSILEQLSRRKLLSVTDYEKLEIEREKYIESAEYAPDYRFPSDLYKEFYQGQNRCFLKEVKGYQRYYEWS